MNCAVLEPICLARFTRLAACLVVAAFLGAPAAASELPDLSDPKVAMETWLRLKGDLAGRVTYEWAAGTAYGAPLEGPSVTLFSIESVTIRQFWSLGQDRYEERTISCRLYKDADSGDYIDGFVNPLTGRQMELKTPCSSGQPVRYSPERMELLVEMPWESSVLNRPVSLQWLTAGDEVIIRRESHSAFTAASGVVRRELAIDTFRLPAKSLADTGITSLSPSYSWDAVRDWSRLLDMPEDLPGQMFWSVVSRKFQRPERLPTAFRAALEERYPGALGQTLDWEDDSG